MTAILKYSFKKLISSYAEHIFTHHLETFTQAYHIHEPYFNNTWSIYRHSEGNRDDQNG